MKKWFGILLCAGIALIMTACSIVLAPDGYNLIGPAGGFVFYDKGSYSDGWRYLECAPEDAGTGTWDEAIQLCEEYSHGGYDDWLLPDKDELKELWDHGSLSTSGGYWSSLEWSSSKWSSSEDGDCAWGIWEGDSSGGYYYKSHPNNKFRAQPVRRF